MNDPVSSRYSNKRDCALKALQAMPAKLYPPGASMVGVFVVGDAALEKYEKLQEADE